MTDEAQDPKIIVDEDWKSQVQAEKEATAAPQPETTEDDASKTDQPAATNDDTEQPETPETPETPDDDTAKPKPSGGMGPIPPASLDVLLSTLAAQAMTAMGHLPDPMEGHPVVRPDLAKHYIDMVGMLEEKTKGNLTPDEAKMLDTVLHELRMIFVSTRNAEEPKA